MWLSVIPNEKLENLPQTLSDTGKTPVGMVLLDVCVWRVEDSRMGVAMRPRCGDVRMIGAPCSLRRRPRVEVTASQAHRHLPFGAMRVGGFRINGEQRYYVA